jgi:hypothetical protein
MTLYKSLLTCKSVKKVVYICSHVICALNCVLCARGNSICIGHEGSVGIRVRVQLDSPILWIDMYIPSADAKHRQRRELCH